MSNRTSTYNEMTVVKSVFVWVMGKAVITDRKTVGELLTSPVFSANDLRWKLSLRLKNYSDECEEFFMLILQKEVYSACKEAVIVVSFLDSQGKPCFSRMECIPKNDGNYQLELEKFVSSSELTDRLDELLTDNKIKIKCEIFPKVNVLENMYSPPNFIGSFNNPKLSDVTFVVDDKRLYGHKIILSNRSEVFSAMFEHSMKESLENVVYIEDISYDIFVEMMRFIYSGQVNGIQGIAKDLLPAADKYALLDLMFVCGESLCNSVTSDNVVELLSLADHHDIRSLKLKTLNYIASNSRTLINIPKFKNITSLHKDLLFEVIQALSLEKNNNRNQPSPGNVCRTMNRSPSYSAYTSTSHTYAANSPVYASHSPVYAPHSLMYEANSSMDTFDETEGEEDSWNFNKKRRH